MVRFADKLVGKKVVIVGGTSGIGYGTAELLLEAGAHVTVISSKQEKVDEAVKRLNSPHAQGKVGNLLDEQQITETLKSLAPVDHVILSSHAGLPKGTLADSLIDEAKKPYGVKFWGSVIIGKVVSKHDIIKPGGSLTLTSGWDAPRPKKGAALSDALNNGVKSLTESLSDELSDKRIRVNTVSPGWVRTAFWDRAGQSKEEQDVMFEGMAKKLYVGFIGTPEDVAESYLYLVRADYANGSIVAIDGGGLSYR